ncbi:MAG: hypothetical protein Q9162_002649 [Coniocarpon cinnabarinum]
MAHGHAAYVAGVGKEYIGTASQTAAPSVSNYINASAGETLQNTGEGLEADGNQLQTDGVQEMKAAAQDRSGPSVGGGKAEETLGAAVGCEGMREEGAATKES